MSRSNEKAEDCGSRILLSQLSHELAEMESALSGVQEALSELVARSAPEPDMIRRLQTIDAITQTAENLAWVLAAMAQCHPAAPKAEQIRAKVGMKDVGDRLASAVSDPNAVPPTKPPSGLTGRGEIAWF